MILRHSRAIRLLSIALLPLTLLAIRVTGVSVVGLAALLIVLYGTSQVWFQRLTLSEDCVEYRNSLGRSVRISFCDIVGLDASEGLHLIIYRRVGRRIHLPWRLHNVVEFTQALHRRVSQQGPVELLGDTEELLSRSSNEVT